MKHFEKTADPGGKHFEKNLEMKAKDKNKEMTDAERMIKARFNSDIAIGLSIGAALIAFLAFILSVVR